MAGDSPRVGATAWILLAADNLTDLGMGSGSTCPWSRQWFEWVLSALETTTYL